MTQTKLVGQNGEIILSDGMLYVDEHDWSPIVGNAQRTLSGAMVVQEFIRKGGRPMTLKSLPNRGWLRRHTLNALKAVRDTGGEYQLHYLADGTVKQVAVVFDSTQSAITATPVEDKPSPNLNDYFAVELRFLEI